MTTFTSSIDEATEFDTESVPGQLILTTRYQIAADSSEARLLQAFKQENQPIFKALLTAAMPYYLPIRLLRIQRQSVLKTKSLAPVEFDNLKQETLMAISQLGERTSLLWQSLKNLSDFCTERRITIRKRSRNATPDNSSSSDAVDSSQDAETVRVPSSRIYISIDCPTAAMLHSVVQNAIEPFLSEIEQVESISFSIHASPREQENSLLRPEPLISTLTSMGVPTERWMEEDIDQFIRTDLDTEIDVESDSSAYP